jgi:hypothetical protein
MPETAETISGRLAIRSGSVGSTSWSVRRSPTIVRTPGSRSAAAARSAKRSESNTASRA